MRVSFKTIVRSLAVLVVVLFGVVLLSVLRWQSSSAALLDRLEGGPLQQAGTFSPENAEDLPAPVAKYFHRVLRRGQPAVRHAMLTETGEFLIGPGKWTSFRATQHVMVTPPGFVWDARIRMIAGMNVFVRDAYVGGGGTMEASLLSLYSLTRQSGRRELDSGALQRYLGEAVWLPTALLPSAGVTWTPLNDRAAIARLTDGETTVSVEFRFDPAGDVVEVYAADRFREVAGRYERTPWTVTCSEHAVRGDMRIPLRCEVAWLLPSGPLPYWRGRIETTHYDLAR
jgi:Family of unknown function (DUF6544)